MPDALYAKGRLKVYRQDGRYIIKDGLYRVENLVPVTLAEAKSLVDGLAQCTVCGGEKITACHNCNDGLARSVNVRHESITVPCYHCIGRGYVTCPRCKGTGCEPG